MWNLPRGDCERLLGELSRGAAASERALALARKVRARWPHIGIIVVSGQSTPQPQELPAGSHFHRKPYDADAVVRHARELTAV